jgi:hypothetical protein
MKILFKQLATTRAPALCAAAVILFRLSAAALTLQLPDDESGLAALLEENAIDTFQYEQLLVYYALPLSVPQGELALLIQAFPDIEGLIPDNAQIEDYQPFDNRQIQRLFGDFPALAGFEPVLRFNAAAPPLLPLSGEVIFGINKSGIDELKGQRVRFRQKSPFISTEGSVTLSDSGALWNSRRVDLQLGSVNAQFGNFKQPIPGELAFGIFSPTGDEVSISSNWLYATSNSWNGLSVNMAKIPWLPSVSAGAFYHIRAGERGAGGAVNLRRGKQFMFSAGVSGFDIGNDGDNSVNDNNTADGGEAESGGYESDKYDIDTAQTFNNIFTDKYHYTIHMYCEYKSKTWKAAAESSQPVDGKSASPALSFRLNYKIKESSAEYRLVSFPANFNAPMSRAKKQTLAEIGEKTTPPSAQSSAVQKHSLRMSILLAVPLAAMTRLTPEVDFTESGGAVRRVYGRAELRARAGIGDFALKHSSKIFTAEADSILHTSSASVYLQADYPVEIRATGQSAYGYYKNARHAYTFELICTALPGAAIAPFISGKYVTKHEYRLGLKTELHLYKKIWTGITIEIPVNIKEADNVYIKGSSSYAF